MNIKQDEKFQETQEFVWLYDIFGRSEEEKKYCEHCTASSYLYVGAFENNSLLEAIECFMRRYEDFKGSGTIHLTKYEKQKDGWKKDTHIFSRVLTFTTMQCLKDVVIQIGEDLVKSA